MNKIMKSAVVVGATIANTALIFDSYTDQGYLYLMLLLAANMVFMTLLSWLIFKNN